MLGIFVSEITKNWYDAPRQGFGHFFNLFYFYFFFLVLNAANFSKEKKISKDHMCESPLYNNERDLKESVFWRIITVTQKCSC